MSRAFPAPTRRDHQAFSETEGWSRVRNAKNKTGTHHVTYELALLDGAVLRTRISHPPDRSTYGNGLWQHILRDQLKVTESQFWNCVRDKTLPERGDRPRPQSSVPAALVHQLVVKFHVPESEVAAMTKQQAIERLAILWAQSNN